MGWEFPSPNAKTTGFPVTHSPNGAECLNGESSTTRAIVRSQSSRKDHRLDAQMLARLARMDSQLLSHIHHRSEAEQFHLTETRARAPIIDARTSLINAATLSNLTTHVNYGHALIHLPPTPKLVTPLSI